ncbi:uncharacterized protein F4807DRAFT_442098 [Annulohypoxylon truncatum]|uniref:uncharacterized protein n=1 Tax=Annulohypoxylon truncatum TaxID=327061 RepID=UPI0020087528|nr:uncharacterized protein F4807DRAFT_442098 [Annulohypoxylon truncatum]KAI1205734.1 hypothetical protein F4807DRAFT_442098 [Annulohypoxylon truncatum]
MSDTRKFELSAMDNVMPRFFISLIFTFRLKDEATYEQVLDALRKSLVNASEELPLLRRRAFEIPVSDSNKTIGRLEAREHVDWTPEVGSNDLSAVYPDYDELMDEGLPQDMMDGELILPPGRKSIDLEAGTPLFLVQANYVEGGLILGVSMLHSLVDGTSAVLAIRTWAKHMRIQQGEVPPKFSIAAECCDYKKINDVWEAAGAPVAKGTPEDWRLLGLLPPGVSEPPIKPAPPMITSIFYFSANAFARLAAVATATNDEKGDDTQEPATVNDALMALLWRCVMRARQTAAPDSPSYSSPDAVAELDTTLDGRGLLRDKVPSQYMGTMVYIVTTRLPFAELVAPSTPLRSVLRAFRRAVNSVTGERALEVYGLAATRLPSYAAGALKWPFATFDGAESCFSSWLTLPMLDIAFGGRLFVNGGVPDHVRPERRLLDLVCRNCNVFPLRAEGGAEVLISLTADEMPLLESDPEFLEYAQLLCH